MMVSLLLHGYCVGVASSRRIEQATYLFPLPPGAVVNKFTLIADGKEVKAKLLDKDEARRIYEDIVPGGVPVRI